MSDQESGMQRELGITRRDLMRRGAIVGGTLLWVTPVVQSLGPAAFAHQVSPANHFCCFCSDPTGGGSRSTVTNTQAYCISDGGVFPDGHPASAQECGTHCSDLGFDSSDFHTGPNPFTCSPTAGGGCSAH